MCIFALLISPGLLASPDVNVDNYICLNYVKNYNPSFHPQNWCIGQDMRGIIYVANNGGLLEYDGVSWRSIKIPNHTVRALAVDDNGIVYIGGVNEIGFLAVDTLGSVQYKSLGNHLTSDQKKFSLVFRINITKKGIYFRTKKYLFRWDAKSSQMKAWEPEGKFDASFTCNGELFIHQRGIGLMKMVNNSLEMISGTEKFAEAKIYMMVPYDNDAQKVLIGTRSKGFYLYDGIKAVPFPTNVDKYLEENRLYHGIRLSSSSASNPQFAVATQLGGLVIIDSQGRLKYFFSKKSGLQDDSIYYVFEDNQGNLWLALDKGISKIEYASPISTYDNKRSDLAGIVLTVSRHGPENDLYAGTTRGLFFLTSQSQGKFHPVPGFPHHLCRNILSTGNSLLVATNEGVFQVDKVYKDKKNSTQIREITDTHSNVLHRSQKELNRIWVGTRHGLISLRLNGKNNQWKKESKFENINEEIKTILEDQEGNLWLGLLAKGVLRLGFSIDGTIDHPFFTRYDKSHGLPPGTIHVYTAAGKVIFCTDKGIFRFDKQKEVFVPDRTLGDDFAGGSEGVFRIVEDKNKNIWFHSEFKNFQSVKQPDGTYVLNEKPFLRIPFNQANEIYPDPGRDIIWFAINDGLIRYDTTVKKNYLLDFSILIREVVVNETPLIYDSVKDRYKTGVDSKKPYYIIPYKDRNLNFEFASPFYEDESRTQYQFFLKGFDKEWSQWSTRHQTAYKNLDSGFYIFRVRARNVYENLSPGAVFKFKILLPWYRTWWAFLSYIMAFFLLTYLVVKWWRSIKLEREKQRLEQVVKERTKEINDKNRQLEEQSEKLKEMDKVKSRFFANISHEFRTPLTLIMGPLEQMLAHCPDREMERKINLMLRNSQRLLNLINQLLDLSKFDSGRMKLQTVKQDIVAFLKGMVDSFELAAQQHEVDLTFHSEKDSITIYFDTEKMENVMCNLLINAIKFTPPGGKVTVSITASSPEFTEISIRDTGIGIPRDQLEYIFDRFFQAEEPSRSHHLKGTGIGLALTKELVNLHHGRIDVHSRMNEPTGTEFIIQLPMGKEHLKPEEIIEIPGNETPGSLKNPVSMIMEEEGKEVETIETGEADNKEREPAAQEKPGKDIILVVEDSIDVRQYIRGSLEPTYTVVEAKNGAEGIDKAKKIIPDLIISDVMMPGIDGYELCRVLKKEILTSHIPIILLTAKASNEDMLEGLGTGADDYITKPFNTKILCARIKNLIDLRRQLQQNLNREMTLQPVKTFISEVDKEFFKDMHQTIEKFLSESDFNVEQLGKKLYMSRATLYRKIMALTGETPTEYIRTYRLKRGAELLKNNYGTVLEVALEVGFSSSAYFTKCFKEKFHQLPSELQASEGN